MFRRKPSEPPPAPAAVRVMPLYDPPCRIVARRLEPVAARPTPLPTELVAEFESREWGYGVGVRIVPQPPQPTPPAQPQTSFVIPKPDWKEEERERREREAAQPPPPEPPPTIVDVMLADGAVEWPVVPGPPLHVEPLRRFEPQPVDWEAERQRAIEQNRRAELERARQLLARERRAEVLQEILAENEAGKEQPR